MVTLSHSNAVEKASTVPSPPSARGHTAVSKPAPFSASDIQAQTCGDESEPLKESQAIRVFMVYPSKRRL
jgi:hypothetical protein